MRRLCRTQASSLKALLVLMLAGGCVLLYHAYPTKPALIDVAFWGGFYALGGAIRFLMPPGAFWQSTLFEMTLVFALPGWLASLLAAGLRVRTPWSARGVIERLRPGIRTLSTAAVWHSLVARGIPEAVFTAGFTFFAVDRLLGWVIAACFRQHKPNVRFTLTFDLAGRALSGLVYSGAAYTLVFLYHLPPDRVPLGDWGGVPVLLLGLAMLWGHNPSALYKPFLDSVQRFAAAVATAVEARDPYTYGHSLRVAEHAVNLGRRYGLAPETLNLLKHAAILHDVGKLSLPDSVLLSKARALKPEDLKAIRSHPIIGDQILAKVPALAYARGVVRHHHERWDGTGYPDGLAGEEIPLWARIVAIADAYDAVTSDRPYRRAMPPEEALAVLRELRGRAYDPRLVDLFLELQGRTSQGEPLSEQAAD